MNFVMAIRIKMVIGLVILLDESLLAGSTEANSDRLFSDRVEIRFWALTLQDSPHSSSPSQMLQRSTGFAL